LLRSHKENFHFQAAQKQTTKKEDSQIQQIRAFLLGFLQKNNIFDNNNIV